MHSFEQSDDATLAGVLRTLGDFALQATWSLRGLEVAGAVEVVTELHRLCDEAAHVGGHQLRRIAEIGQNYGFQVIECEFVGRRHGRNPVVIRAVDGKWWDVDTEDEESLRAVITAFPPIGS